MVVGMKRERTQARTVRTQNNVSIMLWRRLQEGGFILLSALSLFLFVALITYSDSDPGWSKTAIQNSISNAAGKTGAFFSDLFFYLFGYIAYLFPIIIGYGGFRLFQNRYEVQVFHRLLWVLRIAGYVLAQSAGCGLATLHFKGFEANLPSSAGGILGQVVSENLIPLFGTPGATLLLLASFLAGITLTTGLSWFGLMGALKTNLFNFILNSRETVPDFFNKIKTWRDKFPFKSQTPPAVPTTRRVAPVFRNDKNSADDSDYPEFSENNRFALEHDSVHASKYGSQHASFGERPKPKITFSKPVQAASPRKTPVNHSGVLPDVNLLEENSEQDRVRSFSTAKLESLSREVEARLLEFGVPVTVVGVYPGPVITRFELELAAGIKVSKITSLSKDLARALSVSRVRVVEVIPGKSVVGLEIPNEERELVRLREILESSQYVESTGPLTLALGKDISGEPVVVNLAKMPHLLVAGTTGSGKSVGINAMLLSLLYKATPEDVRLILIDPKMLELAIYDGIPHLLTPVVTDMKDAANVLRWCVGEMERRYQVMAALGVRNIIGYNRKISDAENEGKPLYHPLWEPEQGQDSERPVLQRMPYIVVMIDEFADMMMVVGKKVEELIARIAQKARAAGIHMILATQRPSVDVITGLIKANVPTRIAYQVSSRIDSRTILDQQGAEQLLGHGDMLYLAPGSGIPIRIHGAFVSDDEVHSVVKALKQLGEPDYAQDILGGSGFQSGSYGGGFGEDGLDNEEDELYEQAVQIVRESRKASISHLQRRLKIGYNRAARLVETMEYRGIVSPMQANGNREVLGAGIED